jgi:hypothetical protein
VLLVFWFCGCTSLPVSNTAQHSAQDQAIPQAPATAGVPSTSVNASVPYIRPPNSIDLCGEPVPLDRQDVYERFDKEFTLVVYNHAQVYLWLKRMERYFPAIEERLRYFDLPDDLKYVAIVESDLLPNVCSPKGAAGPWQFMPSTGAAYGLEQRRSVDKRYDFECSTDSAFLLLKDLYTKYHSWSLAIAAYNCGDRRILDESRIQGASSYYDLRLPQETERYVFRILAVKAVLSDPNQYGYDLPKGWGYQEIKTDRVNVSLSRPVPIQTIAGAAGTTYREIKRLNPIFRSDDIPAGNHEIKLPPGAGAVFKQNFSAGTSVEVTASQESRTAQGQDLAAPVEPWVTQPPAPAPSRSSLAAKPAKAGPHTAKQKTKQAKTVSARAKLKAGSSKVDSSQEVKQKTRLAKAGSAKAKQETGAMKAGYRKARQKAGQ